VATIFTSDLVNYYYLVFLVNPMAHDRMMKRSLLVDQGKMGKDHLVSYRIRDVGLALKWLGRL
jgi:hypothetical protein